jgi:hypothetical protein
VIDEQPFSAKNSGFSNPCGGKFDQAAIGNSLKMMDVGSLSGDPTPGSNFATLRALGPVGCWRVPAGFRNPPPVLRSLSAVLA